MNAFDYVVKLQEIQKAKTQNAIKGILVSLVADYKETVHRGWGRGIEYIGSMATTEDVIMYYHIFKIGITNYPGTGIQDYILTSCRCLEDHLKDKMLEAALEYEQFMEAFKYTDNITLSGRIQKFTNAVKTVDNRPLPCAVHLDLYCSSQYSSLFNECKTDLYRTTYLLELEALKRKMGRNDLVLLNTVLDRHYAANINELTKTDTTYQLQDEVITLLRTDLNTVMQETERRLNEQANAVQDPLPEAV